MKFSFKNVTFSQNENHRLVMTAVENGQTYALEFLDSVTLGATIPGRCSTTRSRASFGENTHFTAEENTLLAVTEVETGIKICNLFTVTDRVKMDTWVEATGKVYDAALVVGRTKMDPAGFTEVGGDDAELFFPIEPCPPTYGFKGHLVLRGENRYFKVQGGFLWQENGLVDAHFQSGSLHEDITCFTKENPIVTVYAFAECENEPICTIAPRGKGQKTGTIVSGKLSADYAATADGVSLLCKGNPYPITAMLVKEIATGALRYLDTESGWNTVTVAEKANGTEFFFADHKEVPGVGLRIFAEICPNSRLEWSVEAINHAPDHTLIWCRYPNLHYAPDRVCDLFHPYGGGAVEVGFNRTDGYKGSAYPAGLMWSMPYIAAYSEEKDGIYENALSDTVAQLLPIVDNLERAAMFDDGEKVKEGLVMTAKATVEVFAKLGVEDILRCCC